jgi:hypothetical protein
MKKKIQLNKKTIRKLKLQLKPKNDRKVAPALVMLEDETIVAEPDPTIGQGCQLTYPIRAC